jgi:hypothetical protein
MKRLRSKFITLQVLILMKFHYSGGKSNFSLGWDEPQSTNKYVNKSNTKSTTDDDQYYKKNSNSKYDYREEKKVDKTDSPSQEKTSVKVVFL